MTITRASLVLLIFVLMTDYKFGNGRLVQSASDQISKLVYTLNSNLVDIVRRISP